MHKFWVVIRDKDGALSNERHSVKGFAIEEAERLCHSSGDFYYILETIGIVKTQLCPVEYVEITE